MYGSITAAEVQYWWAVHEEYAKWANDRADKNLPLKIRKFVRGR